jgi:surface antigen
MWGYLSTGGADGNGGDGFGYGCRQCASYAAWRIAKETGIYYRWGNAKDFTQNARNAGYEYLGTNPQPGSIAVMDPAKAGQGYGHIAWVEAVSGGMVTISQYNYDYGQGYGMYSVMTLSASSFDHYVKIK